MLATGGVGVQGPIERMLQTRVTRRAALAAAGALALPLVRPGAASAAEPLDWSPLAPPAGTARAIYSIDITRNMPLFAQDADLRLPMASTTKIATALTVRKHAALEDLITIDDSDLVDITIESNMSLLPGMVFSVEELLYGIMLPSGSDAAKALARAIGAGLPGGDANPRAAFVAAMNQVAAENGLVDTNFTNMTGLDDPDHYTTARELAMLAGLLMRDATLATIVATPLLTVTSRGADATPITLVNTNKFLDPASAVYDPVVFGLKTGSTQNAGGCLVLATAGGPNVVVTTLLGSDLAYDENGSIVLDTRWEDMRAVLASLDESFLWVPLEAGAVGPDLLAEMAAWGVELQARGAIVRPLTLDGDLSYRLRLGEVVGPGSVAGRVLFLVGSTKVADLPVYQISA